MVERKSDVTSVLTTVRPLSFLAAAILGPRKCRHLSFAWASMQDFCTLAAFRLLLVQFRLASKLACACSFLART